MKYSIFRLVPLLAVCATAFILFSQTTVNSQSLPCRDVYAVFARGSGQALNNNEWNRFDQQLRNRLSSSKVSISTYQLGSQSQNGHKYPAVDVNKLNGNLIGAWAAAGTSYDYGNSVSEGTQELGSYLIRVAQQCPDSKIILGGYSQGAQVIGQSVRSLPQTVKDKIVFSALFGDPKLFLPEGRGLVPPACLNEQFSPWRRKVDNCNVSSGVLQAREPYLPTDMENKTGLWCLNGDIVCGSWENMSFEDNHGEYKDPNGPIDYAAREAVEHLKTSLARTKKDIRFINTVPDLSQPPLSGADVMFMFDNSTNMNKRYYEEFVGPKLDVIIEQAVAQRSGMGFVTYYGGTNREWINYKGPKSMFGTEIRYFALNQIQFFQPEKDLSHSLAETIHEVQELSYFRQPGIPLIIVIFTNSPYNASPVAQTQRSSLSSTMARLASTRQPALVYPVVPADILPTFNSLASSNIKIVQPSDTAIRDAITANTKNPQLFAELTNTDYMAPPGTRLTFDASSSIVYDDTITKYDWDFESDGTVDQTTTTPTISRTYPVESNSTLTVHVSTASGLSDTGTAAIRIINPARLPPKPKAPVNLTLKQTSSTTVRLTWDAADTIADSWIISLNGVTLGRVAKDQHFINISDIIANQENIFGVQALTADNIVGEQATVSLEDKPAASKNSSPPVAIAPTSPKATNIFTALGSILGLNTEAPSASTQNLHGKDSAALKRRPPLIYYIIGGILITALVSIIAWVVYKKLNSKPQM